MNFKEVQIAVNHLVETCKCPQCKSGYFPQDINVVATTKTEGLFEVNCAKCETATIVTVFLAPEGEVRKKMDRTHRKLTRQKAVDENDILDIKNFLADFDGNFKKLFNQ